jgi:23S rRNA (cytosine1962-C5)-methyltransferase
VLSVARAGAAGDLAVIFDEQRRFVAIGLYDPTSPIRIRVLQHGAPAQIDRSFWGRRIDEALARRSDLRRSADTDGYRLIHGENDELPGLVVDCYGDVLVVKIDSAAWFAHLADVIPVLLDRIPAESVVLRMSRTVAPLPGIADGDTIAGRVVSQPVLFRENGLMFEADVAAGQKTGHFLDQRDNRQRVRLLASQATVLDVFCCTGGFSVYAAAGGARAVHSVDLSRQAIAAAGRTMEHNVRRGPGGLAVDHRLTTGDAFEVLERCRADGERYDIVVVDPPSFARRLDDVPQAVLAYRRLATLAAPLVRSGGLLVQCSCSSRIGGDDFESAILAAVSSAGRRVGAVERFSHGIDHPIGFAQGEYLKSMFIRLP